MGALAKAVATFGERVEALAHDRVSHARRGDHWEVRVRPSKAALARGFSADEHALRLGGSEVRLANDSLRIVRVDFANGLLQLQIRRRRLLARAQQLRAEVEAYDAEISTLLVEAEQVLREVVRDPLRTTFARRALRGIGRMAADASSEAIAAATAAATDTEVVIRALEQPSFVAAQPPNDPLFEARLRGLRERDRLLNSEGGTWDSVQVASHLHLTRQGVSRRRRLGTLLGIDVGRRGYRYPAWQFVRAGTVPGLERVLAALHPHDPWMQLTFALNPNPRLDGATPLQALRDGQVDRVESAAQAFGEHGAA